MSSAMTDRLTAALRLLADLGHEQGHPPGEEAADEIEALRARVAELEAERKWQPIETAPKDGSYVILARVYDLDGETMKVVTFGNWTKGYGDASDEMGINSGWNDHHYSEFDPGRDFGNPDYMREPSQPTHWRPLPQPPEDGV